MRLLFAPAVTKDR